MPDFPKWITSDPHDPVVKVARRSLEGRLRAVEHYLPLAAHRWRDRPEHVHQLRVWSRRAQVAIDVYRELLPEWRAVWIEKQLKRMRSATNAARDADVFAERLTADLDRRGAARLLDRVMQRRREEQAVVTSLERKLSKDDRLHRRVSKVLKRIRLRGKAQKTKAIPSISEWAATHLGGVVHPFLVLATGDLSDSGTLHRCRIAGKRVRYAMELFGGALPDELRDRAYQQLEELQDRLGVINDHVSAEVCIQNWLEDDHLKQKVTDYLSDTLEHEREQLAESEQSFLDWWTHRRRRELEQSFEPLGWTSASQKTEA